MITAHPLPRHPILAAALAAALALAGCATPQVDAQWTEPQFAGTSLQGRTVLVACESAEQVVQRLCAERLASEVTARGATAVIAPPAAATPAGADAAYLPNARNVGAQAVLVVSMALADSGTGRGMSLGLGGFGVGSGRIGAGVGLSVPIGGGEITRRYAANARLTDVPSGRLMWTARATSTSGSDVNQQMDEVMKTVMDAAQKSQVF